MRLALSRRGSVLLRWLMRREPGGLAWISRPRIAFTRHAELRAGERRIHLQTAADLVLDEHGRRRRNLGTADWIVRGHGVGVAYDWPAGGDATVALVVTVWRE